MSHDDRLSFEIHINAAEDQDNERGIFQKQLHPFLNEIKLLGGDFEPIYGSGFRVHISEYHLTLLKLKYPDLWGILLATSDDDEFVERV